MYQWVVKIEQIDRQKNLKQYQYEHHILNNIDTFHNWKCYICIVYVI